LLGDAFADLPPIPLWRIEGIDCMVLRSGHNAVAVRFRRLRPKIHAPETQTTDAQTRSPEMDVLHVDLSFKMLRSLYKHQKCSRKPDTMRFGSKFLCENLSHAC